jgi:hypothetical protein
MFLLKIFAQQVFEIAPLICTHLMKSWRLVSLVLNSPTKTCFQCTWLSYFCEKTYCCQQIGCS